MDVQVVEGRDQKFVPEINHLSPPIHILRQFLVDAFYLAVRLDDDIAVLDDLQFIRSRGV